MGDYQVQQSVEFGFRINEITGSVPMYDTLVNQHSGPRLLQQSLSMRAPAGGGNLFDNLTLSSFGWGGDPQNVARLRVSKFRAYDFNVLFRRDRNYFDYDLLANPLNPPTSTPAIPANMSPHSFYNTRRMYDFDLTILPQSRFSFRIGATHNRSNGPSFSSVHEGTDALLFQGWNVTDNLYRFGFDVKVLPQTTISYDQYLDYAKNDTDYSLAPFATFLLANGTPVEFGLPWNTAAGQPCAKPIVNGAANPGCSTFLSYLRNQRVRSTTPTEQLRVVSNAIRRVNVVAQATYANTDLRTPYLELFNGLITRNGVLQDVVTGPVHTNRVNATADLGVTVEITKSLRVSESLRYDNWHLPGFWNSSETTISATGTPPFTLFTTPGPSVTTSDLISTFLGMRTFRNLIQLEYNPSRHFGVHAGYQLRYRNIFKADPETIDPEIGFEALEGDNIKNNQQGPVFGIWLRPTDKLRINAELETLTTIGCQALCANPDEIFVARISPKQQETYRGRISYKPVAWADVSASINWWEARNGESDTAFKQHNRSAGFSLSLFPNDRLSVDLSYNYNDLLQDAFICYTGSFVAPGRVVNGCPTFDPTDVGSNPNPNSIYSTYNSNTHYFSGTVMFKPVKKLSANLGYGVIKTDGSTTLLNPLQPLGPLQFTYHQPLASLSYEVVKDWSINAYWNYDQYNEGSFVGPTFPRYFHDNRTVLSFKYAF